MGTCKTCGKEFHACGSCNIIDQWEWSYCSYGCMETKLDEVIQAQAKTLGVTPEALRDALTEIRDTGAF